MRLVKFIVFVGIILISKTSRAEGHFTPWSEEETKQETTRIFLGELPAITDMTEKKEIVPPEWRGSKASMDLSLSSAPIINFHGDEEGAFAILLAVKGEDAPAIKLSRSGSFSKDSEAEKLSSEAKILQIRNGEFGALSLYVLGNKESKEKVSYLLCPVVRKIVAAESGGSVGVYSAQSKPKSLAIEPTGNASGKFRTGYVEEGEIVINIEHSKGLPFPREDSDSVRAKDPELSLEYAPKSEPTNIDIQGEMSSSSGLRMSLRRIFSSSRRSETVGSVKVMTGQVVIPQELVETKLQIKYLKEPLKCTLVQYQKNITTSYTP